MSKYLDENGLLYLWTKIKAWVTERLPKASTTTPLMDGTANVGSESTFARGDHRHPTDTSRVAANDAIVGATKTKITYDSKGLVTGGADLTASDIPNLTLSKITDVTATAAEVNVLDGITATTEELNIMDGVTATTTEINYVDGVTSNILTLLNSISGRVDDLEVTGGEPNLNAFSNIKVGNTTVLADTKTDTLELAAGTSGLVAITPDATNDKVTIEIDNDLSKYDNTTSGFITSASLVQPTTTTPKMDGTASVGTETKYAKGDHVHPTDTSRQATITGGATTITSDNLTASRALISNGSGKVAVSDVTSTELGYLDGVTSNVLTQLNSKADKVTDATANNLAALDANGNLIDSGVSATSAGTDTKNTAGSTNDAAKLYIVGAKELSANPQTYSQLNAYITAGKVYSNAKEVVNLSDTQALSNKTYNGYTLGNACEKGVDTSITSGSTSVNVPTTAAVEERISEAVANALIGVATFKGIAPTTFAPTNYKKGYYWVVQTAGTYVGQTCEAGDMIFCISDYSSAYSASDFSVIQNNMNLNAMSNSDMDTATNNWA